MIIQFKIGKVVVGESANFKGGIDWLKEKGVEIINLKSQDCIDMLRSYIEKNPEIWNEDIGE